MSSYPSRLQKSKVHLATHYNIPVYCPSCEHIRAPYVNREKYRMERKDINTLECPLCGLIFQCAPQKKGPYSIHNRKEVKKHGKPDKRTFSDDNW